MRHWNNGKPVVVVLFRFVLDTLMKEKKNKQNTTRSIEQGLGSWYCRTYLHRSYAKTMSIQWKSCLDKFWRGNLQHLQSTNSIWVSSFEVVCLSLSFFFFLFSRSFIMTSKSLGRSPYWLWLWLYRFVLHLQQFLSLFENFFHGIFQVIK